jgi:glucose dehydrogenase
MSERQPHKLEPRVVAGARAQPRRHGQAGRVAPQADEMLKNPAPGDWLVIRRDHYASNFSPLTQITRDNAQDLQLAWVWPMNEGGTNQPSPLAYNGTVFLNNTNGIIQALNGKTGDLIWEHRLGGNISMRGIALYGDKLFVAMSDANLVALDATNGKQVWKVPMTDGRGSSSGPLAAKGKLVQGMGGCQAYVESRNASSAPTTPTPANSSGASRRSPPTARRARRGAH